MKKIGIVGCGTIGSELARKVVSDFSDASELVALCDIDNDAANRLIAELDCGAVVCSMDELVEKSDLVIEAAGGKVSADVAIKSLTNGRDVLIMSVGGLLERWSDIMEAARKSSARLIVPSGALSGLDAVKAAAAAGIDSARLTTRKPPRGLTGAPFIVENNIDLDAIEEEQVIFEGTTLDAVKGFPKNINVAAALSLAGIGPEKTMVRIMTSPEYTTNSHEIEVTGAFGRLVCRTENVPSPTNPKTSYLAVLSPIATLKTILYPVRIGS
jgi:aspartate dehydrogenase